VGGKGERFETGIIHRLKVDFHGGTNGGEGVAKAKGGPMLLGRFVRNSPRRSVALGKGDGGEISDRP